MKNLSVRQYIKLNDTYYNDVMEVVQEVCARDMLSVNTVFFFDNNKMIDFKELSKLYRVFDTIVENENVYFVPNKHFWEWRKNYLTNCGLSDII